MSDQIRIIIGKRHRESCLCGCQFVDGTAGEIVQDSDTPKLAELGLAYVRFATKYNGEQVVCYSLEEIQAWSDQIRISDTGELETVPTTWDGEPLYSPASVAEGLFDADAFKQMPGQIAMDACWCDSLPGRCSSCIAAAAQDADELEKGR